MNILLYVPSYGIGEEEKDVLNFDSVENLVSSYYFWARRLCSSKYNIYFAVVGGIFLSEEYQTIPISDIMVDCLLDWRIPRDKIFSENKSVDSWENIKFINIEIKKHFPEGLNYFDQIVIFSHKSHFRHYRIMRSYGVSKEKLCFSYVNYDFLKKDGSKDRKRYVKEFFANCISIFDPKGCWFPILLYERKKRRERRGILLTY
ncbi:YdcF family protein [Patescibacteria group bacterium]|nr:YdcF family protein [Patescibacteria group bacterium]